VDVEAVAELSSSPAAVFAEVRDLGGYPAWLGIVQAARPLDGEAWSVDLGARIGPLRRSKRVRMVRVADQAPSLARFERVELDGRSHSPWILNAGIEPVATGARLTVHLHYGGRGWLPLVELALREEIRRAGPRLAARLGERA
jgi:hypothetical protein